MKLCLKYSRLFFFRTRCIYINVQATAYMCMAEKKNIIFNSISYHHAALKKHSHKVKICCTGSSRQFLRATVYSAYMLLVSPVRLSDYPSIRLSHGWISRKRLKLGSCNFHHTVAPSLQFLRDKFHPEILTWDHLKILTGSPQMAASNKGGGGKLFSSFMRQYLENGRRYVQSYIND